MQKLIENVNRRLFNDRNRINKALQSLLFFWFGNVAQSEKESVCSCVVYCCWLDSKVNVWCVVIDIH